MTNFWLAILDELKANRSVFVAIVAECSKGSPGTTQSRLIVRQDGSQYGTIGGGVMEKELLRFAGASLKGKTFQTHLQRLSHTRTGETPSGLICGGSQTNVLSILQPGEDSETASRILAALESGSTGSITFDRNGLSFDDTYNSTRSGSLLTHGDSDDWSLLIDIFNTRRIAIFGAGHCGIALAKQMFRIGYHVTLLDQRQKSLDPIVTACCDAQIGVDLALAIERNRYWSFTSSVVMTHSYPTDLLALSALLPVAPPFIGVMGSPPKLARIFRELAELGFTTSQLKRITAPVGLAIGSDTPEEIAVSIAAQILQMRNTSKTDTCNNANYVTS